MAVLTVHTGGKTEHIQFDGEVLLADLLHGHPGLVMPCGGRHTCGKCRVKAAGGLVSAEEQELKLGQALQKLHSVSVKLTLWKSILNSVMALCFKLLLYLE